MYEDLYGLGTRPFDLTPDRRFLYLTPNHSEALAHLEYGLTARRGITVLIGEVGTGKTTLLRAALERARQTTMLRAHLSNPMLTRSEFFQMVAAEFGLSQAAHESKAQFLLELIPLVEKQHAQGGITALVIDEAQSLPFELLEEIRLLANIESETEKLLQVLLVGQPELADRLNEPQLRQLKQRIALRCTLGPMNLRETAAYIAGRIRIAGGDAARVFTREAVSLIYERTQGIPRVVNVLCENALITGFARGKRPIDRQTVLEVCADFDVSTASAPAAPAVSAPTITEAHAPPPQEAAGLSSIEMPRSGPARVTALGDLRSGIR